MFNDEDEHHNSKTIYPGDFVLLQVSFVQIQEERNKKCLGFMRKECSRL